MASENTQLYNFVLQATKLPLGPQLYAAAMEGDEQEGIKMVKKLMEKQKVAPDIVSAKAPEIYKFARDFIKETGFPSGGGVKY